MCSITVLTSIYNSQAFLEGYFKAVAAITDTAGIEILLIHNLPNEDELAIIHTHLKKFSFIRHIVVAERESLYASWNRGINLAQGKYVAVWNVDDIRAPGSFSAQCAALESSNAAICYGDFDGTDKYGPFNQRQYQYGEYKELKKEVLKRHIIGCFPMWRKDIHQEIGYFDEQFRLVGDFDFQIRVALKYELVKAGSFLGYYLENQQHKLSSNRKLQDRERTVVELRYRVYDKILLHVIPFISGFRINQILYGGNWIQLKTLLGPYNGIKLKNIFSIAVVPFSYTGWVIKRSFMKLVRVMTF